MVPPFQLRHAPYASHHPPPPPPPELLELLLLLLLPELEELGLGTDDAMPLTAEPNAEPNDAPPPAPEKPPPPPNPPKVLLDDDDPIAADEDMDDVEAIVDEDAAVAPPNAVNQRSTCLPSPNASMYGYQESLSRGSRFASSARK